MSIDALKFEINRQRSILADPRRYREHRTAELALMDPLGQSDITRTVRGSGEMASTR
jgi:hypothetical protein